MNIKELNEAIDKSLSKSCINEISDELKQKVYNKRKQQADKFTKLHGKMGQHTLVVDIMDDGWDIAQSDRYIDGWGDMDTEYWWDICWRDGNGDIVDSIGMLTDDDVDVSDEEIIELAQDYFGKLPNNIQVIRK